MTAPGWYDDGQGQLRYWDGQQWTQHTAPLPNEQQPAQQQPAQQQPEPQQDQFGQQQWGQQQWGQQQQGEQQPYAQQPWDHQQQFVQPWAAQPPSSGKKPAWLPWVIGVVALALVAGGGFAVWKLAFDEPSPGEVAREYIELQHDLYLTGDTDFDRLCDLMTKDMRAETLSNFSFDYSFEEEAEEPGDASCSEVVDAMKKVYDESGNERSEECVDSARSVNVSIDTSGGDPDGSKAEVKADVTVSGLEDWAEACELSYIDEDEEEDSLTLQMEKVDGDWRVAALEADES